MILSFSLQGVFLGNLLRSGGAFEAWLVWGFVLLFVAVGITCAAVKASRLAKQYRHLKWGET